MGIMWMDKISNNDVLEKGTITTVFTMIRLRRLKLLDILRGWKIVEYQRTSFMVSYKWVRDLQAGPCFGTEKYAREVCITQTSIWLHGNRKSLIVFYGELRSTMK
jgi:hypothetical protein